MDILSGIKLAIAAIIPLVLGLTMHEVAKAWTAKKLGDRYTLRSYNPKDYIDNVGTLLIPLLAIIISGSLLLFGWCRPAAINVSNIKSRKDRVILYLSGSIANILMIIFWVFFAIGVSLIEKVLPQLSNLPLWEMLMLMAQAGVYLNIIFICFSLFPLLPFDGGKIVTEFLPRDLAMQFRRIEPYSMYIMLFIVFFTPIMTTWYSYINAFIQYSVLSPLTALIN